MAILNNSNPTKIDKSQVKIPLITFSESALRELKLIIENDFTLAGKYFRLVISGKGCDGFTYSAGFTDLTDEDLLVPVSNAKEVIGEEIFIAIDPFAAFYMAVVSVDFILDPINDLEGFVITNHQQKDFHGKFWKTAPEKTPPLTTKQEL